MHISDGVLSGPVCIASAAAAALVAAWSLKKTRQEDIPAVSVMTAMFFAVSLIHIKLGVASTHLLLNGLMGIILGISSFAAIVAALLLQAVMFNHGGITSLGANVLAMGIPALAAYGFFRLLAPRFQSNRIIIFTVSYVTGTFSILISGIFIALYLAWSGKEFRVIAWGVLSIHIPIALVEGLITALIVSYLKKVKPDMFPFLKERL